MEADRKRKREAHSDGRAAVRVARQLISGAFAKRSRKMGLDEFLVSSSAEKGGHIPFACGNHVVPVSSTSILQTLSFHRLVPQI